MSGACVRACVGSAGGGARVPCLLREPMTPPLCAPGLQAPSLRRTWSAASSPCRSVGGVRKLVRTCARPEGLHTHNAHAHTGTHTRMHARTRAPTGFRAPSAFEVVARPQHAELWEGFRNIDADREARVLEVRAPGPCQAVRARMRVQQRIVRCGGPPAAAALAPALHHRCLPRLTLPPALLGARAALGAAQQGGRGCSQARARARQRRHRGSGGGAAALGRRGPGAAALHAQGQRAHGAGAGVAGAWAHAMCACAGGHIVPRACACHV